VRGNLEARKPDGQLLLDMNDTHLHDAQLTEAQHKNAPGKLESRLKNEQPSY
jgi:hypothetical protein